MLPNESKKIYLTFDAGYELGNTARILDILDHEQIKAAFFITGPIYSDRAGFGQENANIGPSGLQSYLESS